MHGPSELVAAARAVKQFLTFHGGTPLQPAVADALALDDAFFAGISSELARKRDLLSDGPRAAGFDVLTPRGTYFVVADASPLGVDDGVDLAWKLPGLCGVAAVPVSVFCSSDQGLAATKPLVRFAFCKRDEVLLDATERPAGLRDRV